MTVLALALALGLLIWALTSKHDLIRITARIFTGLLSVAALAAMVFLFGVGQKAHWTSDGPGMLLIMIGVPFCGLLALFFGGLTLKASQPEQNPPLN